VLRELAAGCRAALGPDHPGTITSTSNLGLVLRSRGKLEEADELLRTALDATRGQPGDQSLEIAGKLDSLALVRLARGLPAEAETLLRESLALRIAREPDGWRRYDTTSMLGESLAQQGRHDEAEPLLVEAWERIAPPAARAERKRDALVRLIENYRAWGRREELARFEALLAAPPADAVPR
jgi:tetratricopeptide (TPR) repeat protein